MTASISARMIEALTAIATGLHDIADAVRAAARAGGAQIATQEPAEQPRTDSAGRGASGGLDGASASVWATGGKLYPEQAGEFARMLRESGCVVNRVPASEGLGERLRELVAEPDPEESQYESVDVAALVGLADEAHRLEVHARVVEQSLRTARAEGDGARIKGAQWKARYEETRDANRRVQALAQWFRDQGQVGYGRKVEEAVEG